MILSLFLFLWLKADAAVLFLDSKTENLGIGDSFGVNLKINNEDVNLNAAQATIKFPPNILEVASLDYSDSVFDLWLQEPYFSNNDGTIGFIGGSSRGLKDLSLQILKIVFRVKGNGIANLIVDDAAVTANDGRGTNILSLVKGLKIIFNYRQEFTEISFPAIREVISPEPPISAQPIIPKIKLRIRLE